jgi:hypothetical protein
MSALEYGTRLIVGSVGNVTVTRLPRLAFLRDPSVTIPLRPLEHRGTTTGTSQSQWIKNAVARLLPLRVHDNHHRGDSAVGDESRRLHR